MTAKIGTSIFDWSQIPTNNTNAEQPIIWQAGMMPSQIAPSSRAMMASIAKFISDDLYNSAPVLIGANNIVVNIAETLNDLVDGMTVKFRMPLNQVLAVDGSGQPYSPIPKNPLLKINGIPSDKMGNGGDGLPIVYTVIDPQTGQLTVQAATPAQFSNGALITLVYRKDIKVWTQKNFIAEQMANLHLKGDKGLGKADSEWETYASDLGVFQLIDDAGAGAASAVKNLINTIFVGQVAWFDSESAPQGYLICDGSEVLTQDYPLLAAVLNGRHGATATSFNLPDLRGRFIRGIDGNRTLPDGATDADKNVLGKVQPDLLKGFTLKGTTDSTGSDLNNPNNSTSLQTIPKLQPGSADGGDQYRGILQSSWNNRISVAATTDGSWPIPAHKHNFTLTSLNADGTYQTGFGIETRPMNMALLPCIFAGFYDTAISIPKIQVLRGEKGEKGDPGQDGIGITSITQQD